MARFTDKVMFITGGGAGLGRECALQWARGGASVVVSDLVETRAQAVCAEIMAEGGKALGVKADVTIEADVQQAVELAVDTFGRLDVMFANAGRNLRSSDGTGFSLEDVTQEQWDDLNDVIYRGVFFAGKHACRVMKNQSGGNIVVTISAAATNAYPGFAAYGAGKAGLIGLVKGMANDWGRFGIRVNALAPTHGMSANFVLPSDAPVYGLSYEEMAAKKTPWDAAHSFPGPLKVNRPPSLKDNANVASFLASDESEYMSGVVIPSCDGGSSAISSIQFTPGFSWQDLVQDVLD